MGLYNGYYQAMEDFKKKSATESDREIVFSKAVKAGKRIYYFDVKKNRKDEMFLAITESKKIVNGEGEAAQVSFEKHKIFLYKEDFAKFFDGLQQTIGYIEKEQGTSAPAHNKEEYNDMEQDDKENDILNQNEIKIDINF